MDNIEYALNFLLYGKYTMALPNAISTIEAREESIVL